LNAPTDFGTSHTDVCHPLFDGFQNLEVEKVNQVTISAAQ
jgi:hypothetical protein